MISRRTFVASGLRGSALISLSPTLPAFLARTARAAEARKDDRVLVVVQLGGGNDGINTVVPFKDEGYARSRKGLRIPEAELLKFAPAFGLHPAMGGMARLLESGRLAIVPGVGYPNPSRSHFQSMATWQSARIDPVDHTGLGWLGLALDGIDQRGGGASSSLHLGPEAAPPAIRGRRSLGATLDRVEDFALADKAAGVREDPGDDLGRYLRRSLLDAYSTAGQIEGLGRPQGAGSPYPDSELARRLRLAAGLLKAGFGARVYYLEQDGYDTHAAQLRRHGPLLGDLSAAIKAFLDDLAESKLADRVLVFCFSEFGRRVEENGSGGTQGTDHGTSGPVFLAGTSVRPGLIGKYPSLTDLEDGDLKLSVDFRRVYASLLEGWLGLPSKEALGGIFEPLTGLLA